MQNIPTKVDGVSTLPAAEFNQIPDELENSITDTGQTLTSGTLDQASKAMSIYAAGGNFYTDSGAADAYVLSVIGSKKAPIAYFNGMSVRFLPGNVNTGASTVNVATLGVKNIKLADGSTDPAAGDLPLSKEVQLTYDGTSFRISSSSIITNIAVSDLADGTDGELITWDAAGAPATIAAGTATYVLTANGPGAPATFQAAGGGGSREFIETQVASSSATIDFSSSIDNTSALYMVELTNVVPASSGAHLYARTSTNGGASYDAGASDYNYQLASHDGATYAGAGANATFGKVADSLSNTASDGGYNGTLFLFDPSATSQTIMRSIGTMIPSGGVPVKYQEYIAARLSAADVDAFRFLMSTGNIASGRFTLSRINHS